MGVEELERSLAVLLGEDADGPVAIADLRRLSGGASRETWSFDAEVGSTIRRLILQRLRPGASASTTGIPIATEADLISVAGASGVPVATLVAHDDGGVLGSAGMVVERLDGETIARKILRDDEWATARSRLGSQVGAALAAIHALPPDAVAGLRAVDPVEQFRTILDTLGEPHPAFELGFRWLDANRPADVGGRVVHGDFRLGNLLVDHDGLRAVLDWELAHLGDPLEDLGWFCVRAWRFGAALPAGGVATREELVAAYEAASGAAVDPAALRWWEVLGTLKWGVICVMQAWGHLGGAVRSVEMAAIGRRVCENEWDLLGLLPGGDLPGPTVAEHERGPDLYGRPTAGELVEAVREWVDGDVRSTTEGRVAFHARVAVNALAMLERQLQQGPGQEAAHAERLRGLGYDDDEGLAAAIRRGDEDARIDVVRAAVAASVRAKLEVANPRWLEPDE
ncbi:MAG: phosphotransferase family protein [Acidimicrobiales bacterium]